MIERGQMCEMWTNIASQRDSRGTFLDYSLLWTTHIGMKSTCIVDFARTLYICTTSLYERLNFHRYTTILLFFYIKKNSIWKHFI